MTKHETFSYMADYRALTSTLLQLYPSLRECPEELYNLVNFNCYIVKDEITLIRISSIYLQNILIHYEIEKEDIDIFVQMLAYNNLSSYN